MQSMTGYGSAKERSEDYDVLLEIRSVNHRFFTLKQSLPEGLARCEGEVEKMVRSKIERGSLTLVVSMKAVRPQVPTLPDAKVVKEVAEKLESIRKTAGVPGVIEMETLLALPHLWSSTEAEGESEALWTMVRALAEKAIADVVQMRKREGESIRKDIEARLSTIEKLAAKVEERAPAVLEGYQKRLEDRVATLLTQRGIEIAKADLLKEIAVYADKCDVSEELQRLRSHVEQFRKFLRADGSIGRKLDFLTQEMAREANTLTSKGNDAQISIHAVEIKAELEKVKEQAENIE